MSVSRHPTIYIVIAEYSHVRVGADVFCLSTVDIDEAFQCVQSRLDSAWLDVTYIIRETAGRDVLRSWRIWRASAIDSNGIRIPARSYTKVRIGREFGGTFGEDYIHVPASPEARRNRIIEAAEIIMNIAVDGVA